MKNTSLNPVADTLCQLLAHVLFEKELHIETNIDWQAVYEESKLQTVIVPAFYCQEKLPLSLEMHNFLKKAVQSEVIRNIQRHGYHAQLHQWMCEQGIPYSVLKGVASAHYYPDPFSRMIGDVDFLVPTSQVEKARLFLESQGFQANTKKHYCHIALKKEELDFELHFDLPGVPDGDMGQRIHRLCEDFFDHTQKMEEDGFTYVIPSDFHHGLVMLMHMQHHLLSEGIGLRHLCDWAVFVNHFDEEPFVHTFQEKLEQVGLWRFAQILSHCSEIYLGLPHQSWMHTDDQLAINLMKDIFSGGNFGRKDTQRQYEGMFISNRGKNGVDHARLVQFIEVLNGIIYTHWPFIKRWKIFLPFGWVFFSLRRIVRIILGTRDPVHFKDAFRQSAGRKELYAQFSLYKPKKD